MAVDCICVPHCLECIDMGQPGLGCYSCLLGVHTSGWCWVPTFTGSKAGYQPSCIQGIMVLAQCVLPSHHCWCKCGAPACFFVCCACRYFIYALDTCAVRSQQTIQGALHTRWPLGTDESPCTVQLHRSPTLCLANCCKRLIGVSLMLG